MIWKLKTKTLHFSQTPLIMGIVNVTPDSFSDGGKFFDHRKALDHAMQLVADGADILDFGGESTRPYSEAVSVDDELNRVIPVIEMIAAETETPISIDTMKAKVADAAIKAGAEIINDVTGLEGDPEMIEVALSSNAGICAMHMQGTPQTMQNAPKYDNVVEEIYDYLKMRFEKLTAAGIDPERVCLDPGIGFGKTHEHNIELLRNTGRFLELRCPILIGHSRKGFIGKLIGDKEADRCAATLGVSLAIASAGAHIIRVHDVQQTRHALTTFTACRAT